MSGQVDGVEISIGPNRRNGTFFLVSLYRRRVPKSSLPALDSAHPLVTKPAPSWFLRSLSWRQKDPELSCPAY